MITIQGVLMAGGTGDLSSFQDRDRCPPFIYQQAVRCGPRKDGPLKQITVAGLAGSRVPVKEVVMLLVPAGVIDVGKTMRPVRGERRPVAMAGSSFDDGPGVSLQMNRCKIVVFIRVRK
jgi:2-keto-3-deoxy-galactonokinase